MICQECNGRGETIYYVETDRDENTVTIAPKKGICRSCNGSGKMPQTNADRIRIMNEKEKMIELIARAKAEDPETGSFTEWLAEYLLEHSVSFQTDERVPRNAGTLRWVSVLEALPELFECVIVCRPGMDEPIVEQGRRNGDGWWKVYGTRTKAVTHWMPLPKPPKGE